MATDLVTQFRLKDLLHYDPETGEFTWLLTVNSRVPAGRVAGCLDRSVGYWQIRIDGKRYYAHRLAWLYMTGDFPPNQVDHRNRNRLDNRWDNLRAATNGQNGQNSKPRGVSKYKGVCWSKSNRKWQAQAQFNGKTHYLGIYDTEEAAAKAYAAFAAEHFPKFARLV